MRWANKKAANTTTGISLGDINTTRPRATNVTFNDTDGSRSDQQHDHDEDRDEDYVKTIQKKSPDAVVAV